MTSSKVYAVYAVYARLMYKYVNMVIVSTAAQKPDLGGNHYMLDGVQRPSLPDFFLTVPARLQKLFWSQ